MGNIIPWILMIGGGIASVIGEAMFASNTKNDVIDEIKEDYVLVKKPDNDN